MRPVHLALLGPFDARRPDGRPLRVRRRKAQAVLAYLAMRPEQPQPRETLLALLWEDATPARARHNLRQTLTLLRRDLAPSSLATLALGTDEMCLDRRGIAIDVTRFESLAAASSVPRWESAVALYRGEFLEGLVTGSEAFDRWVASERERLRAAVVEVLDRLLQHHARVKALPRAIDIATRLLAIDPLREDVHRMLMRLYADVGRPAAALRQYRVCASILHRELGVTADPETLDLHARLLERRSPALAVRSSLPDRYLLAADGAVVRSAFPEAVAFLDRGLSLLDDLPDGPTRSACAVDLHLGFERVLVPLRQFERLSGHIDAAKVGAARLGDGGRLARAAAQRMSCLVWNGDAEVAVATGERVLRQAIETGDTELALTVRCRLAQACYYVGDYRRGVQITRHIIGEARGDLSLPRSGPAVLPAVGSRVYLALCLQALGHVADGREAVIEAIGLAERAAHEWSLAFARYAFGNYTLGEGRARDALAAFKSAWGLRRDTAGTRFELPRSDIGLASALAGRPGAARALLQPEPAVLGDSRGSLPTLARWHLHDGRIQQARRCAQEAVTLARAARRHGMEARGLLILARALACDVHADVSGDEARRTCLEALRLAEALGMRPLSARCHDLLGDLWERAGEIERARAARGAAAELRREMSAAGGPLEYPA